MTDSPNAIIVEVLAILLVIVPVLETRDVLVMLIILFAVTVVRWVTLLVSALMRPFAITAVSLDILPASARMLLSAVTVVSLVILLVTALKLPFAVSVASPDTLPVSARTKRRWI